MQARQGTSSYTFQARQSQKRAQIIRRRRLISLAVLLLALSGVFFFVSIREGQAVTDTFFMENVFVDDVDLSGMTEAEAQAAVKQANAARIDGMKLTLEYGSQTFTLSAADMGVELDYNDAMETAYAIGRAETRSSRRALEAELEKNPHKGFTGIYYSETKLKAKIGEIAKQIYHAPVDAAINFAAEGGEGSFNITAEANGLALDEQDALAKAAALLKQEKGGKVELAAHTVYPSIKAADLEPATNHIVTAATNLSKDSTEDRNFNIEKALKNYNGLVLMPGEQVSFNDLVGPRTEANGYRIAKVILNDDFVDGPGGGVCQASTTIYHAAVKAGLEIVQRSKHSLPVSYVEKGQDATVDYGTKDLIIKNNTEYPVFFATSISSKKVSVAVYGRPIDDGMTISILTEQIEEIPAPEPEIIVNPDPENLIIPAGSQFIDKPKSRPGYTVKTYRIFMKDGKEVKRVGLYTDKYRPVTGKRYMRLAPIETPAPEAVTAAMLP